MSETTTKVLYIDGDHTRVVAVRPQRWTDEQWQDLVNQNREYYKTGLVEEDWTYGE